MEKFAAPISETPSPFGDSAGLNLQEKSKDTISITPNDDEEYPEGGLRAWLVVFGAWCGLFAGLGIMNIMALLQAYVSTHQLAEYSEDEIGWIFSVYSFLAFSCGIYVGPVFDKYGPRWLILTGSICTVASLMGLSLCNSYLSFFFVFGVLNGVGAAMLFTPCYAAVGHFFRARRGLATGIASAGGSVGGIVFPLFLQKTFANPALGWGWGLRILGFVCLFFLCIANMLIRKRLPPSEGTSIHPDPKMFKEKVFFLTTVAVFLMEFALFIPLAYLSSFALSKGFSEAFSFQLLTILASASFFGRTLPGWWADRFGPFNSNMLSVLLSIVACFAVWLPFGHTKPGIIVFAVMFGFSSGNNITITPVCIGRLCHTKHYGRYYATCFTVVSIACLVGIPIGGKIISANGGNYSALIIFTGALYGVSLVVFLLAKGVSVGWKMTARF